MGAPRWAPRRVAPPTEAPLRCDGVVRFHLEICGESGHWCERTMTFAFRDPTPVEAALLSAELAAYGPVRAAGRPGATLRDLAMVFENSMDAAGFAVDRPSRHFDFRITMGQSQRSFLISRRDRSSGARHPNA